MAKKVLHNTSPGPVLLPEILLSSSSKLDQLLRDYKKENPFKAVKNQYSVKGEIDKKKTTAAKKRYYKRMNKWLADKLMQSIPTLADDSTHRHKYRYRNEEERIRLLNPREREIVLSQPKYQSHYKDIKKELSDLNVLSPLTVPLKMADFVSELGAVVGSGLTGGDYGVIDFFEGRKSGDIAGQVLLDPLNFAGVGSAIKTGSKIKGLSDIPRTDRCCFGIPR